MNLTSLFSFNYLKENFKKSKAIICLCILLVPIINAIFYLMQVVDSTGLMPSFMELSPLLIAGMYIIPFILSLTLFGFVYKRKSSDFVMSMPISKKQIFITNTIGGIIVILLMHLFNSFFIGLISLIFPNVYIDFRMIGDLFLIWSISYIFVFCASNLAMSVSGNRITTFIVLLLIVFLVPFIHTFITSEAFRVDLDKKIICEEDACKPAKYYCYNSTKCELNRKNGIYDIVSYSKLDNTSYTMPYALIKTSLFYNNSEDNVTISKSIIKMVVLSILYVFIGLMLFNRRKFEIVETSFKSERVHLLVRSLTTIPIVCICYLITASSYGNMSFLAIIFLLVLVIAYLLIYDLITRKKIVNFGKSMLCLIIVTVTVSFIGIILDQKDVVLEAKDIDKIAIINSYDNGYVIKEGYASSKKLINYVMSINLNNESNSDQTNFMEFKVHTKNNNEYLLNIVVSSEEEEYILDLLHNDENYKKTAKKANKNDVFAIKLGANSYYLDDNSSLYDKIVSKLDTEYKKSNNNYLFNVSFFIYDDFNIEEINISVEDDKDLCKEILNIYNKELKDALAKDNFDISYYYVDDKSFYPYSYGDSDIYKELNKFIVDNIDDNIDMDKEYKVVRLGSYLYNGSYTFVTNKVTELNSVISSIESSKKMTDTVIDDENATY